MSRPIHPKHLLAWILALALGLSAAGCGEDGPTAPSGTPDPEPEQEIRTPVSMVIRSLAVTDFNEKKGSVTWDASISVGPRAPDIYVTVQVGSASSTPIHTSEIREDAFTGVAISWDMSESAAGLGLPKTATTGSDIIITLYDDDGLSPDDEMGSVTFDPLDLYRDDNASGYSATLAGDNQSEFKIGGTWVY